MTAEIIDPRLLDMIRVMSGLRSIRADIANVRAYLHATDAHLQQAEDNITAFVKDVAE